MLIFRINLLFKHISHAMTINQTYIESSQDGDLTALIRNEQRNIIYKNTLSYLLGHILLSILFIFIVWDKVPQTRLMLGIGLLLAQVAVRAGLFIAYHDIDSLKPNSERRSAWFVFFIFVSGSLWGAVGVVYALPASYEQFLLIVLMVHALGAASYIANSPYLPVFYAFFLPLLLPLSVAIFLEQNPAHIVIAYTTLLFVTVVSLFARNLNKVFTESLRLRFENTALVDELVAQKNELIIQKESAERANAAKTRFLAAASHDLRQPLHSMGLFVSALIDRVRDDTTRNLVMNLNASTEALRGLLNSLLDISRLDAGVIQPKTMNCSIQDLYDRLAHDFAPTAKEKNISLKFRPCKNWVRCDLTLFERILRNIVSNAIRYTEQGGVLVGCRHRGDQLRIETWDTGIGIPQQELANIFHEFYQVGNPERDRDQGLGLGLAIAQRLARLLNHRIDVKSVPGKGSVFAITLPLAEVNTDEIRLQIQNTPGDLHSSLVVVIDDELAVREATQIMLEGWGCDVVTADSGDGALDALTQYERAPEVIIADYRLRNNKTGVEAIKSLHAQYGSDIPAIIITGDTAPDRILEAETSGYHLLHKPLAPARLRALLSHVLAEQETPKS